MTDDRARFRLSPDVVTRETADGLVLVDLESGAAWGLDEVGAEICRRLDGNAELGVIRAALLALYDVSAEQLDEHLEALLDELQGAGLVEPADA